MKKFEYFTKKLNILRDFTGEINKKDINQIKEFDKKMEKAVPGYIGSLLFGSVVKGYSDPTYSDIDLKVLYDPEKADQPSLNHDALEKICSKINKELTSKGGKSINFSIHPLTERSIDYVFETKNGGLIYLMADLSRFSTGKKIKEYRDYAHSKLNEYDDKIQKNIINKVLKSLVEEESKGLDKIADRLSQIKTKENVYLQTRETLWENRLIKLWSKKE